MMNKNKMLRICDKNIELNDDVEFWSGVKKFVEESGDEYKKLKYIDDGLFFRNGYKNFINDIELLKIIDKKIVDWVEKYDIDSDLVKDEFYEGGEDGFGSLEFDGDGIEGYIVDFNICYVIKVNKNVEMSIIKVVDWDKDGKEVEYKEGSKGFERCSEIISVIV